VTHSALLVRLLGLARRRDDEGGASPANSWRLRVLQQAADDGNVARACRRFGISRESFYKWKRRHAEHAVHRILKRPAHGGTFSTRPVILLDGPPFSVSRLA
jgi:hypothetical protein